MAAYVFYLWGLAVYVFRARVAAVKSGSVNLSYFKAYQGEGPPNQALVAAQHYDNQFQVPMLFFATCCAQMIVGEVNIITCVLAWAFIATRVVHSWVHLGRNQLKKRILSFALGWLVILGLWAQLVFFVLT